MKDQLTAMAAQIENEFADLEAVLMEVCGTHTHAIRKAGIHQMLPNKIKLLSGPGCPVCVTGSGYLEQAILLSQTPGMMVATFGDLLKVPGNSGTLSTARASGGQIKIVYSPLDAVDLAAAYPDQEIIFLGVGFETTAPVIALAVQEAALRKIGNFSILPALKVLRPALEVLLSSGDLKINGLIAPGHLSVILGADAFNYVVEAYHLPTVITGFRPAELWLGIAQLLKQLKAEEAKLFNAYPQAVTSHGNLPAQKLINEIFVVEDAQWRGLGVVKASGLGLADVYRKFDARFRFGLKSIPSLEPAGCLCGEILLGKLTPMECIHFGKACQPEHPIGPCMVASEGTCAAQYHYRELTPRLGRTSFDFPVKEFRPL